MRIVLTMLSFEIRLVFIDLFIYSFIGISFTSWTIYNCLIYIMRLCLLFVVVVVCSFVCDSIRSILSDEHGIAIDIDHKNWVFVY